jgi:hypothetical protein
MVTIAELMAKGLDGVSRKERLSRAWAALGVLIGGLTMVRAVASIKTADLIAIAIKKSVINIAGEIK